MKIIFSKRAKALIWTTVSVCVLALLIINILGLLVDCRYISVFAAAGDADKYEIRSRLLMEAMDSVGACSAEGAAEVWAKGLKMRSAALQYSVMSGKLKKEYERQLETNAPNWVTGMSSPWVSDYKILRVDSPGENTRIITLTFSTETSSGPARDFKAMLTIRYEDGFWRIENISADSGLYPYMGFDPGQ